ncbi:MAG: DUF2752 domain-containing protein [Phycisphaerales bacterium]
MERLYCAATAAGIGAVLIVATKLTPDARGFGTHRQLGLSDCAWAMWFKKPCMTCGMTTSFAHTADGDFVSGFLAQPAGFLLCILASAVFWCCAFDAVIGTGMSLACLQRVKGSTIVTIVTILALAWWYKSLTWPNT